VEWNHPNQIETSGGLL